MNLFEFELTRFDCLGKTKVFLLAHVQHRAQNKLPFAFDFGHPKVT